MKSCPRGQQEAQEPDFLLPNLWPHKHVSAGAGLQQEVAAGGCFQAEQQWEAWVTRVFPAPLLTNV